MATLQQINEWAKFIESKIDEHTTKFYPNTKIKETITTQAGSRYVKIITNNRGGGRSVYCFVERETGDIYKSASWRAPAKHKRGNIFDENGGWGKAVGPYGAAYLR